MATRTTTTNTDGTWQENLTRAAGTQDLGRRVNYPMRETLQELALQELAWYRVLTLKQILTLTGYRNEHHARDQLNSLREKDYIYLKTPYMSKGRLPGVYQLLPKGKQYLMNCGIAVPYSVPSLTKLQASGTMGLQHTLRVNDVFILLQLLTVQYPERFQLIKRIHEREMSRYLVKSDGGVEPDGFFQMNKQGVFLEYERTSAYADMEKYQEKIRQYLFLFDNASKLDMLFGVKTPQFDDSGGQTRPGADSDDLLRSNSSEFPEN